jgi:hypothetical protein
VGIGTIAKKAFDPTKLASSHTTTPAPKKPAPTTTPTPTPTATPTPAASNLVSKLESDWQSIIAGQQGLVDIAVYDSATGQTAHYTNSGGTFNTASIVKLSILEKTLVNNQAAGIPTLTADQLANAEPMIENSDNNSATNLWIDIGGATPMDSFFSQLGMTSTTAGLEDEWGLTQTTALDQLKVVNALAYPGSVLSTSSAQQADSLLDQVEADQRWGVSGGVPSGVDIELKNGWLPDSETNSYVNTNDWEINSIGHIHGDGVDYTIAVLTNADPNEQYGINTIQSLSTATWNDLSAQ